MIKEITCIECPKGCELKVEIIDGAISQISGNQCPKGEDYARAEIENPLRILASTVLASGLSMKLVPVRTDNPIPKDRIMAAMDVIHKTVISKPVKCGDVIIANILDLDSNVIASRDVS